MPVLVVVPSSRGLGYALFEAPERLIDWGVSRCRKDMNAQTMRSVASLMRLYQPRALVIEDYDGPGSRRGKRVSRLIDMIRDLAKQKRIRTLRYSRDGVRSVFAGPDKPTRENIARHLVEQYPELERWLPPRRRPWEGEDYRMALFDAVSFGLTAFEAMASKVR